MRVPWVNKALSKEPAENVDNGSASAADRNDMDAITETKSPAVDVESGSRSSQEKLTPTDDAQAGVRAAEAVAINWSKKALAGVFLK